MQLQRLCETFRATFGESFSRWFHRRNIIIVSDHKVIHVPISPALQCVVSALFVSCVVWASYSTGSYLAARTVLKEQNQTLRSVASSRVDTNFSTLYNPNALTDGIESVGDTSVMALNDPTYSLSVLGNEKLFARIAVLERRVVELNQTNQAIVKRVHEKAGKQIADLELLIRRTGLNPEELKRAQAEENESKPAKETRGQGGPFIPDTSAPPSAADEALFNRLDQLADLGDIIDRMPLGKPVYNAEFQSNFGRRIDPFTGEYAFHSGSDLTGPPNAKIFSTAAGVVVHADRSGAYGNMIDIAHDFNIVTRYAHLSQILVKPGQRVARGELIGVQGSTGRSTGPHLHYEVRYHDRALDPKNFLLAKNYVQ